MATKPPQAEPVPSGEYPGKSADNERGKGDHRHVGNREESYWFSSSDLAKTLGRDYKRVHADVSAIVQAGLIVRDENGIRAPYDSIQATVSLSA